MAITMEPVFDARDRDSNQHRALRFLMAGSVDDGKSTLTGRLLYDAQAILGDQLHALKNRTPGEEIDFSALTDGLEAEREQGITIDVAYRYFSTRSRKFIIADAPGHEQYTRNMVTAAAGSDAAVILVDITKLDVFASQVELLAQTRRHTLLANLLRVPSIVFAVNKIDAVPDPQTAFEAVRAALTTFAKAAAINVSGIIPISALRGDNVTVIGETSWYTGPTLLELLESLPVGDDELGDLLLMPVQYVSRDATIAAQMPTHSPRVVWGRIARGALKLGDSVQIFPSNERANIVGIRVAGESVSAAGIGQSAGLVFDRHVDVARGNWLAAPQTMQSSQRFSASLAWMDTEPAQLNRKYLIRHGSRFVQGRIAGIKNRLDINSLQPVDAHALSVNEIGSVVIETQEPLPLEAFTQNRAAGSMIVIDTATHHTSGVLLVNKPLWDVGTTDNRASARIPADFTVTFAAVGGAPRSATVTNVSTGGLLMAADEVIQIGGTVDLEFVLPGDSIADAIDVRARVAAHRAAPGGGYHYHLAFYGIDAAGYERIERFIQRK